METITVGTIVITASEFWGVIFTSFFIGLFIMGIPVIVFATKYRGEKLEKEFLEAERIRNQEEIETLHKMTMVMSQDRC